MRTFSKGDAERAWVCGHWNGSPIEIGLSDLLTAVPSTEAPHHHPYREYYVGIEGTAELEVEGEVVLVEPGVVVMVEPGESHCVRSIASGGARWVVIKERSEPESKCV